MGREEIPYLSEHLPLQKKHTDGTVQLPSIVLLIFMALTISGCSHLVAKLVRQLVVLRFLSKFPKKKYG